MNNMITIQDLVNLKEQATKMAPLPGPEWPPSVYYRYLGLLAQKTNAKLFVEGGTCGGGCARTVALMSPMTDVITIDVEKLPQVSLVEEQCKNVKFILNDTIKTANSWIYGPVDILFIDTDHLYSQTVKEFNAWLPHMRKGGIICFDDLNRNTYDGGVAKFWNELQGQKVRIDEMHISGSPTDGGFGAYICT